jgi:hypothetical protein
VNSDRAVIEESDVIRAYKTYYKLLTTDISITIDNLLEQQI